MADRRDVVTAVPDVRLEWDAWVDYKAPPRFADHIQVFEDFVPEVIYARTVDDRVEVSDTLSTELVLNAVLADSVTVADAFSTAAVFGQSFADNVTMDDNLTSVLDRLLALILSDTIVMADALSASDEGGPVLTLGDTVSVSDAGVLSHYDYAGLDYFLTPFDYVGETRVF
jgi:hypothetical protein